MYFNDFCSCPEGTWFFLGQRRSRKRLVCMCPCGSVVNSGLMQIAKALKSSCKMRQKLDETPDFREPDNHITI